MSLAHPKSHLTLFDPNQAEVVRQVSEIYGIDRWSDDYFGIDSQGELRLRLPDSHGGGRSETSLRGILDAIRKQHAEIAKGPILLRFPQILHDRVHQLYDAFTTALDAVGYSERYQGVTPMKVNQDRATMEAVLQAGAPHHHGLEVGSKAELMAALSLLRDSEAFLVCNGRKDLEYLRLASFARESGLSTVVVIESLQEAQLVARFFPRLRHRPQLGLRLRLRTKVGGSWANTSGGESTFGVPLRQISEVLRLLEESGLRQEIIMLHYHQASQIPSLESVRASVREAARLYVSLHRDLRLSNLSVINVGGGLGIDLGLPMDDELNGRDYGIPEYCHAVATEIDDVLHAWADVPTPTIMSESGRAIIAHSAAFLFPVLEASPKRNPWEHPPHPAADATAAALALCDLIDELTPENAVRTVRQAETLAQSAHEAFLRSEFTIPQLEDVENLLADLLLQADTKLREQSASPMLPRLTERDCYYGNFNLFCSVPDLWGLGHIFPLLPIQRLDELPNRRAIIKDLTCDCYGAIREFGHPDGRRDYLPVHALDPGESYFIGVFLVGAYQEPLAAKHNLLGRPPVVEVTLHDGTFQIDKLVAAETMSEVMRERGYGEEEWRRGIERLLDSAPRLDSRQKAELRDRLERVRRRSTYLS